LIRTPRDAEVVAAEWLRYWGFVDARTHGPGADGGVDVEAGEMVAQVKARQSKAGRPELQQLHGVVASRDKQGVFFSIGGYTEQAVAWANEVNLALFSFDYQGEPTPCNLVASQMSNTPISEVSEPTTVGSVLDMRDGPLNIGSLPSPPPQNWEPAESTDGFVKYARRLRRNGHRVSGYAVHFAEAPDECALVAAWADAGVTGGYVVVDHETGRVEGYPTWAQAYAATCTWDGGPLAPSVRGAGGLDTSLQPLAWRSR
jgi:hypothetical protein